MTVANVNLIHIVLYLVVVGVILGLINQIPMAGSIKSIINGLVVLLVVLWLLQVFGVIGSLGLVHIR